VTEFGSTIPLCWVWQIEVTSYASASVIPVTGSPDPAEGEVKRSCAVCGAQQTLAENLNSVGAGLAETGHRRLRPEDGARDDRGGDCFSCH
jgi:hypothetical protein